MASQKTCHWGSHVFMIVQLTRQRTTMLAVVSGKGLGLLNLSLNIPDAVADWFYQNKLGLAAGLGSVSGWQVDAALH